MSKQIKRINK